MVLTGLHFEKGLVGTYVACGEENEFLHEARRVGRNYPGTGDLFASVLVGEMLRGSDINSAASRASDFTRESIEFSEKCPSNVREGVSFEPLLHKLCPKG